MNPEQYLIGQIFWKPSLINLVSLDPDDFQGETERMIFEAMLDSDVIDEMSISKRTGLPLKTVLGFKPENIVTGTWEHYQRQIINESRKKKIRYVAEKILSTDLDADDMIDMFAEATMTVRNKTTFKIESLPDCIMEAVDDIERRSRSKGIEGLSTGMKKLDGMIGGFQKSKLYYVAARPSQGKSTLLMNFACNLKVPFIFISTESDKEELSKRMLSYIGRINNSHIKNGTLTSEELNSLVRASEELYERKYVKIYDESNITIGRLQSICHEAKKYHDIQAIFIDYAQIIKHPNNRLPRHEQMAEISKVLKQIARDLKVPVIVASQLRRDAEGKKPQLSDFSDSTQLERDADVAIAIYNIPNEEGNIEVGKNSLLCILKNRDGALGDIRIEGQMEYYHFQEALNLSTRQIVEPEERLYF